ncbi:hypothetical protein [Kineococcus sp. R86509]|uniref:hypothetical protein n=1 Tax=Kineococcus sp. R86509 TaxID=3093851 RepID=UPI0036D2A18E
MNRRVLALLSVLVLAGPALTACASPERVGRGEARDAADDIADQLERDLGRGVRNYGVDARDVAGAEVVGRENVELLSASGKVNSDEPALIDVRITGHVPAHDGAIGGKSWPETTVHRCYTFVLRSYYGTTREAGTSCDDDDIDADGKPKQPLAPPPTSPPTIDLGEVEAATLNDALTRFDDGTDVAEAVGNTLPPEVFLDVKTVNGTIGVGLLAPGPTSDCLLGRRLPGGEVEVWIPPAITVAPGEASCDGTTAADGGAKTYPH